MTKARTKPADPQAIAEARRQTREHAEWFDYRAEADPAVIVSKDHRGQVVSSKRQTVFEVLKLSDDNAASIKRIFDDIAEAEHKADQGRPEISSGNPSAFGPMDRALAAQDRLALVISFFTDFRMWLCLRELVLNELLGAPQPWRGIVRMSTGEEEAHCQGLMVRLCVRTLSGAYRAIDNATPMQRPRAKLYGGA